MAKEAPTITPGTGASEDERLKGAIAYVLGFLTGILVLLIGGENKFLKFHAWQSIVASVILAVVWWIVDFFVLSVLFTASWGLYYLLSCLIGLVGLAIWLYFLYGAFLVYSGKPFRVPFVADFVEKNLVK